MPIRPELRAFYRGPEWRATRRRILERAGGKCEQCGVPDRAWVLRVAGWWKQEGLGRRWRTPQGTHPKYAYGAMRRVHIVLTVAHLNHQPGDDRDENLKALCQWCHLNYDKLHHKETRCDRKDAGRPLLQEAR